MKNNLRTYNDLVNVLKLYMEDDNLKKIDEYYKDALIIYENMFRNTGEEYIYHAIEVAYILACLKLDPITIGCALIHEAITLDKISYDLILEKYGEESANILNNICTISKLKNNTKKNNSAEHDRRIIVNLAENPKALFIKLADRTHNMRTIYIYSKEKQTELINETKKIYIPIAHRLGIKKIKGELEDICLRYSKPDVYEDIQNMIKASRNDLEKSLNEMKQEIIDLLNEHEISFEIMSRVKSIYGVYCKLDKGRKFQDIFDLLGIRILVNKVEECYLIIGLLHSKYRSIPKRFKDFISNPKSNMYQSVHTVIIGVDNRMFEIQIRTYEMDEIAERGVASHWSYKEHLDGSVKNTLENKLEMFRSLIETNDNLNNEEFFNNIEDELNREEIYVFTPKGDIIELPSESTPIDFAYRIHSEVGNTTIGAIVNDKIVKLDYELNDGDIVSLMTQIGTKPNKEWLNFVKTDTAKSRIKSFFSKETKNNLIKSGEEMLNNYARKNKISLNNIFTKDNKDKIFNYFKVNNLKELYLNVGSVKITPLSIFNKLIPQDVEEQEIEKKDSIIHTNKNKGDILINGESNILYNFASCCNPIFGDKIIGYVTKGNGVTIHNETCKNVTINSERLVDVSWNENINNKYITYLNVFVSGDNDKLVDIINIATKENIIIEAINRNKVNYDVCYKLACLVADKENLDKFINDLNILPVISRVERSNKNESNNTKK